jgi:hypothetical protein
LVCFMSHDLSTTYRHATALPARQGTSANHS